MKCYPVGNCLACPLSASIPNIGWYCMQEQREIPDVDTISIFAL